jgi:hypothetical protein
MKAGMIFARKTTWRSRLDLEYLDETSSRKVRRASSMTTARKESGRSGSSPIMPRRKPSARFTREDFFIT